MVAISESFIQQLKLSCDITSIVSSYVELKREGRNKKCLCPFHLEKTPSMVVYDDTQSFYCFGCGTGGDVISFIMQIENLDYVEAVRFLAARVGLTVPEGEQEDQQAKKRARILEMNRETARFFHHCLRSPEGRPGLQYLLGRRLSKQTIVSYGLGYAPNTWESLFQYLTKKGYRNEEIVEADLAVRSSRGGYYDKFRNRVIFPIIDLRGNVIGFGGRVLDDSKPKYLNTSDTVVFKKSRNLFSMNFAKNSQKKKLILAEGYMDVIAMYQGGFHNAVATLGTALTAEQARLISRYAEDVIIAYDSDEAGQIATSRASRLFEEAGVETRVLELRDAKDPDEYIKKFGSGRFQVLLDQSENVTKSKLKHLRQKYRLEEPEELLRYTNEACEIIAGLYDKLERDVYAGKLAAECKLTKEVVLEKVDFIRRQSWKKKKNKEWKEIQTGKGAYLDKVNPKSVKYPKEAKAEEGILYFLLNHPDSVEYILSQVHLEDFVTDWNKKIFQLILEKIEKGSSLDLSYFNEQLTPDEMGRLSGILSTHKGLLLTKENILDYVQVLKRRKEKLEEQDRYELSLEEYEKRRQRISKEKGN